MKKYQKLIKDNIDLIGEVERSLLYDIWDNDIDDVKIDDCYLRCIYVSSGALEMIDENYNFDQLPMHVSDMFGRMIFAYAACAYQGKLSHEYKMHCFDLSKEITDNVRWHRIRKQKKALNHC